MRFEPTNEQADFAASLDRLLSGADPVTANRAWADGDHEPGLILWRRLAEQGVHALLVPEQHEGMGASAVELVLAHEVLGRHAVPGPWIESTAYLPRALEEGDTLTRIAEGAVATVAVPALSPYALDGDVAELAFRAGTDVVPLDMSGLGEPVHAIDPTRRLFRVGDGPAQPELPADPAADVAALACAAQLLGAGERVLAETVDHVLQRHQFGRAIGSYQAVKHRLADVRVALDFARPLVWGAALADGTEAFPRSVSAARVAAGDAAYASARAGLQLHGAIGYTRELDLSLWLLRIRALVNAWGTPAQHRHRILSQLVGAR